MNTREGRAATVKTNAYLTRIATKRGVPGPVTWEGRVGYTHAGRTIGNNVRAARSALYRLGRRANGLPETMREAKVAKPAESAA